MREKQMEKKNKKDRKGATFLKIQDIYKRYKRYIVFEIQKAESRKIWLDWNTGNKRKIAGN